MGAVRLCSCFDRCGGAGRASPAQSSTRACRSSDGPACGAAGTPAPAGAGAQQSTGGASPDACRAGGRRPALHRLCQRARPPYDRRYRWRAWRRDVTAPWPTSPRSSSCPAYSVGYTVAVDLTNLAPVQQPLAAWATRTCSAAPTAAPPGTSRASPPRVRPHRCALRGPTPTCTGSTDVQINPANPGQRPLHHRLRRLGTVQPGPRPMPASPCTGMR